MQAHVSHEDVSLRKWVDLASHELLAVRTYAQSIVQKQRRQHKKNIGVLLRLLESEWDETFELGCTIIRRLSPLAPGIIIRICDANRPRVQRFGQELLDAHSSPRVPLVQQLSEHPDPGVEGYVIALLQQAEEMDLALLDPYFRRVLARVNKGRANRDAVLSLIRSQALSSQEKAEVLLPTVQWLCTTSVRKDKANGLETLFLIQQAFPALAKE